MNAAANDEPGTTAAPEPWGRIDADGTVYLRTAEGERVIGQWLGGDAAEGLAMYERRFAGLEIEVELLEKRLAGGALSPDDAGKAIEKVRGQVAEAQVIGDVESLRTRLDALAPLLEKQREERRAQKAAKAQLAVTEKTRISEEAERIAGSDEWRRGADRMRELLEEWKALPRVDKKTDDELWHRFSSARTTYTRRRKAHFGEQAQQRDAAQKIKERLVTEAEALSSSTDWGRTAGQYRDLMQQWKAAGPAPRNVDEKLWRKFRGAQDAFFQARDEANAALDAEFAVNAEVKEQILVEAEALLPITDPDAARRAWHDIADRWEAAGKVPRARIKELEGRIRKVEQAVRAAGEEQWNRTDPEKSARADDMIGKLERAIAEISAQLEQAKASGDARKVAELEQNLASRQSFLDMARRAAADFS
ncbi:DUF349 domain-containing protein [Aeromicrobium sp. IC_218]|uniref:DUF349 domain-containing protein n=1 Tax=Aeromicrobium sp. IC_218 TaxID=2545468 RepID=UPI00103ECCDF|nr:DUF349 domain-containing protein [Aeromicrobium sp. IC_218]TCI99859.1 DUF349 domain-containing protein [Aeromicrobium sp. IC_218]